MKYRLKTLLILSTLMMVACAPKQNGLIIVDDSPSPIGAQNQLELLDVRGVVGHRCYPEGSTAPASYYKRSGSGAKSWVLAHWGRPDKSFAEKGIEYLVYEKKSKDAPEYHLQSEGYVKLGYRNNILASVAEYCTNCPAYMKGPVYVLPK